MGVKTRIKSRIKRELRRVKAYRLRRYNEWLYQSSRNQYYKYLVKNVPQNQDAKVSIIVPVFNTPDRYILPLIDSVYNQGYENWELILADGSTSKQRAKAISDYAKNDDRIVYKKIKNEGIAGNTNQAIQMATGEYIAFMDHDDTLDPDALAETVTILENYPEFGLVYSDEDKISDDGEKYLDPHFKPGFSLDMLRNVNYITHFVVLRTNIVKKVKGIRGGFDGAQDYDFLLRVVDEGVKFAHIPKVLYHWRIAQNSTAADFSNKKDVLDAGCRALDDHYKRNGIRYVQTVAIEQRPGFYKPEYGLDKNIKRAIYVNVGDYDIHPRVRSWILSKFESLDDVKKFKIVVTDNADIAAKADQVLNVEGPHIPINSRQDVTSLFALANEDGVAAISPRVVQHGRISGMGNLEVFRNSIQNNFFGSSEWVRDVDNIESKVYIKGTRPGGRNIIWSHCELAKLSIDQGYSVEELIAFSNRNVTYNSETTLRHADYVQEKLKESLIDA